MTLDQKYQLADHVYLHAENGDLIVEAPWFDKRLKVSDVGAQLLMKLRNPKSIEEASRECGIGAEEVESALGAFRSLAIVTSDEGWSTPAPWDLWGPQAWWFHQRSRNVPHLYVDDDIIEYKEELRHLGAPPEYDRDYSGPVLLLPRIECKPPQDFWDVLERRRSWRKFVDTPLTLDKLSVLLRYAFGPLRFADCGELGVLQLRAAASGGARQETDCFVLCRNVEGVDAGIYQYDALVQGLRPVEDGYDTPFWEDCTYQQGFLSGAGATCVTVARSARIAWKYRQARAYRILLQDAGHAAQVFCMIATALGFGVAITAAFKDDVVEERIGISGPDFATFMMSVGEPAEGANCLPPDVKLPSAWILN
jgi:SagB-type dehydrogenase family enzyme